MWVLVSHNFRSSIVIDGSGVIRIVIMNRLELGTSDLMRTSLFPDNSSEFTDGSFASTNGTINFKSLTTNHVYLFPFDLATFPLESGIIQPFLLVC
jgi:hypothetical protein